MNKSTTIVGGLIIVVLAVAVFMLYSSKDDVALTNATSTPSGTDTPGEVGAVDTDTENLAGSAPDAATNATVAPTDTTVVVTGTVNPNGGSTNYWYEYGVSASLGKQTAKQTVGSGRMAVLAPGYITGLTKDTTYYYRLVAENQYGKSTGDQLTLRTSASAPATPVVGKVPTAKTFPATAISKTSASLRGEVNPNSSATQYWFEYGRTSNLGNTTKLISIAGGTASIVATADPKLQPNTTYYFRVNAQNEFGTVNGTIMSFVTAK